MRQKHGFTLVELIVTLLIIGILSAILIPSGVGFLDKHKKEQCAIQRRAVLMTWEAKKLAEPGADLASVIAGLEEKEQCPSGGSYFACGDDGSGVACDRHGGEADAVYPPDED